MCEPIRGLEALRKRAASEMEPKVLIKLPYQSYIAILTALLLFSPFGPSGINPV